ncbi:TrbI/VirB10 family protein [Allosphingosinicella indica]|uniref:Type IV secretion system protein VirB10 n=1 Tax=Allosphingosinicella indica TaxID=941907 RepID=A0A1X7FZN9_9SPHN|nr:TrbI/VirB10 family protein [Allosphingosinicella indica]SMF61207.1 type IV secretion system protein VirB10 [Allosphingosinicella indica]
MTMEDDSPPPKMPPESLALRGRPVRAIRFRRNLIIAIAAAAALALTLVAWLAFRPALSGNLRAEASRAPEARPDAALNDLPSSYADVPQLGPPLPGDLGRPILARQRAQEAAAGGRDEDAQRRSAERERLLDERRAAAAAPLLVQRASAPATIAGDVSAERLEAGAIRPGAGVDDGKLLLSAGTVVSASLLTGIRSDVPGMVIGQVTSPAYDSPTGQVLLIPQGTRLLGDYDSVGSFGQRRLNVRWQRLLLPDGTTVLIDGARATDAAGNAGLEGEVDLHTGMLLKGAAIATVLGVGAELSLGSGGALVGALRRGMQDSTSRAGDRLVQRNLDIMPTIAIDPGTPIRLLVETDLFLEPWSPQ